MGLRPGQVALVALVLAASRQACAMHLGKLTPDGLFVVGPSLAYGSSVGATDHPLYGVDATYVKDTLWCTLGGRVLQRSSPIVLPYAEAGLWLGVNIGFGATVLVNDGGHERKV